MLNLPCAGRATDHYHLYEKDFDLAQSLNQNAHRFSLEWARLEPEEGSFNLKEVEHYREVIRALRTRGLEPFITLWHFTLPEWFYKKGGFEHPRASFYFSRYVEFVWRELGEGTKYWLSINEPLVYASNAYLKGVWPPFQRNFLRAQKVLKTLISSHLILYDMKRHRFPELLLGVAKNNISFHFGFLRRYFWNFYFLNKIVSSLDFIGLNYYFHRPWLIRLRSKNIPRSDMGWEIYPPGIYQVLKELKKYHCPVFITENGLADAQDNQRAKFIKDHLFWAHRALEEGVDLRGYFYWSLLDNFEWAHGFRPRFGLAEVDYQTLERKIRPSAREYAKICQNNALEV